MPTVFPGGNDSFSTPSNPTTTTLSSAGDSQRNHTQHHRDLGDAVDALEANVALLTHDHSGGNGLRATNQLIQANTHGQVDTDANNLAIHHTLGAAHTQAAPGDHSHPPYILDLGPNHNQAAHGDHTHPGAPIATWTHYNPGLYAASDLYYPGGLTKGGDTTGKYPINLGSGSLSVGSYYLLGKQLSFNLSWTWGQPPYNGYSKGIYAFLPNNYVATSFTEYHLYSKLFTWPRTGDWRRYDDNGVEINTGEQWIGEAYLQPNSNILYFFFPLSKNDCSLYNYRMALTNGVANQGVPYIPNGYPEGGELFVSGTVEVI